MTSGENAELGNTRSPAGDGPEPGAARPLQPATTHFADLALALSGTHDLRDTLYHVVHAATRLIDGVDLASLTVDAGGRLVTPSATDPAGEVLDEVQYRADRGPCLDATRVPGLGLAFSADLSGPCPWREFAAVAAERGVHGVLSVGLFPTANPPRLGALNFYARHPDTLTDADRDLAVIFAVHAGTVLAAATALDHAAQRTEHLAQALDSRDLIGQAKGILMRRYGLTAERAFDVLRRDSQNLNIKLRDLAARIATGRADPQQGWQVGHQ